MCAIKNTYTINLSHKDIPDAHILLQQLNSDTLGTPHANALNLTSQKCSLVATAKEHVMCLPWKRFGGRAQLLNNMSYRAHIRESKGCGIRQAPEQGKHDVGMGEHNFWGT